MDDREAFHSDKNQSCVVIQALQMKRRENDKNHNEIREAHTLYGQTHTKN